jgi:hypothetical protein
MLRHVTALQEELSCLEQNLQQYTTLNSHQSFAVRSSLVGESPLLDKLRMQIQEGSKRRKKENVRAVFDSHKTGELLTPSSVCIALKELGIVLQAEEISELLKSSDTNLNDDDGLGFDEFSMLVSSSSPGLDFLRSLPLAELVWDGLPKEKGCAGEGQLRQISNISPNDLEVAIQAITEGLGIMLHENVAALKKAYALLDSKTAANDAASAKFEMIKMSVGAIKDFHHGIPTRIGDMPICLSYLTKFLLN